MVLALLLINGSLSLFLEPFSHNFSSPDIGDVYLRGFIHSLFHLIKKLNVIEKSDLNKLLFEVS